MSTRRAWLAAVGAGALGAAAPWHAHAAPGPVLPRPESLAAEIERAVARRKALVVMVSLHGCPYCQAVRESHLAPLHAGGQPVVQLEMGSPLALADAHGRASTHGRVARSLGARVAPTVLFLGRDGEPVAPALAGMPIPDFYGAYLEERLAVANRAVAAS